MYFWLYAWTHLVCSLLLSFFLIILSFSNAFLFLFLALWEDMISCDALKNFGLVLYYAFRVIDFSYLQACNLCQFNSTDAPNGCASETQPSGHVGSIKGHFKNKHYLDCCFLLFVGSCFRELWQQLWNEKWARPLPWRLEVCLESLLVLWAGP